MFVVILCDLVYCDDDVASGDFVFFFQAEDGIRDLVRSRGLGDVYKRQPFYCVKSVRDKKSIRVESYPQYSASPATGAGHGLSLIHI